MVDFRTNKDNSIAFINPSSNSSNRFAVYDDIVIEHNRELTEKEISTIERLIEKQ